MDKQPAKKDDDKPTEQTEPGPEKKTYRLKQGQKHGISGPDGYVKMLPGQTIDLTDRQFSAHKDKFDPTEETADAMRSRAAEEAKENFSVVDAGGKKFNVINTETGEAMNERPVARSTANKLKKKLEADLDSEG